MDQKRTDTAAEPVDTQDDEFMDTGVLHEMPEDEDESDEEEELE